MNAPINTKMSLFGDQKCVLQKYVINQLKSPLFRLPQDAAFDGTVLIIETAEDIPYPWIVEYLLMGFGERGWFDRFQAVRVGGQRPYYIGPRRTATALVSRVNRKDRPSVFAAEDNP